MTGRTDAPIWSVEADAHVFVDDVDRPTLAPVDRHHLERVLRLRSGAFITVSDGNGRWRLCRFGPYVEPAGETAYERQPTPEVSVGLAVPKGDRPEWAVQKLTEIGVDRIVLLVTERSVVRWDAERGERQRERLGRVARQAAMQARRAWLPRVEGPEPLARVSAHPQAALCVADGSPPTLDHSFLLVGPEGGWSSSEADGLRAHVGLGPHVLRVETAAVVAGTLLVALRTGLVVPTRFAADNTLSG
jgi:16S rRNA (uracil1498-N3)-methyltransferase